WRTGISGTRAHQIATIAARRDELPVCMELFDGGELSVDQMTAIVTKTPAWADQRVAELAPMLTVRQLRRVLGKYRFPDLAEQDQPEPAEATTEPVEPEPVVAAVEDSCRFWFGDDGRFHLHLEADQQAGMIIDHALREAKDHLFQHGHSDATWPDALDEVAQRSLGAIDSPER